MSKHSTIVTLSMSAVVCAMALCMSAQATLAAEREKAISSKTITYQVGDTACQGYLAWDPSIEGKRPGVLLVHEWWGLNDYARMRADQLAKLGYIAFACDMYGEGKTTTHPKEAMEMSSHVRENVDRWVKRAQAGLDVLKSQEQCDSEQLAAIGYCFGGSTVLQLAYSGADVDAFVTFHAALPVPSPEQAKQIQGPVQINHGVADLFIKQETIDQLTKVLNDADVEWKLNSYPGAKHSFTNKQADAAGVDGLAYNAEADRKSWDAMHHLFDQVFDQ